MSLSDAFILSFDDEDGISILKYSLTCRSLSELKIIRFFNEYVSQKASSLLKL